MLELYLLLGLVGTALAAGTLSDWSAPDTEVEPDPPGDPLEAEAESSGHAAAAAWYKADLEAALPPATANAPTTAATEGEGREADPLDEDLPPDAGAAAEPHHITGGAGDDQLFGTAEADRLEGGAGDDSLRGGEGRDTLSGGNGADDLRGEAGDDHLQGGTGNDTLFGGAGNDRLEGGTGQDWLTGGLGDDLLIAGPSGASTLDGDTGNDTLIGNWFDLPDPGGPAAQHSGPEDSGPGDSGPLRTAGNFLNGGAGEDLIRFGPADIATGGTGADVFELAARPGGALAQITDFEPDLDRLVVVYQGEGPPPELSLQPGELPDETWLCLDGQPLASIISPTGVPPETVTLRRG